MTEIEIKMQELMIARTAQPAHLLKVFANTLGFRTSKGEGAADIDVHGSASEFVELLTAGGWSQVDHRSANGVTCIYLTNAKEQVISIYWVADGEQDVPFSFAMYL